MRSFWHELKRFLHSNFLDLHQSDAVPVSFFKRVDGCVRAKSVSFQSSQEVHGAHAVSKTDFKGFLWLFLPHDIVNLQTVTQRDTGNRVDLMHQAVGSLLGISPMERSDNIRELLRKRDGSQSRLDF